MQRIANKIFPFVLFGVMLALAGAKHGGGTTSQYPIKSQLGIYPPESPTINMGDLPRGVSRVTGWAFLMVNLFDSRSAVVDIDYIAVKGTVAGKTVTIVIDDYGTNKGQLNGLSGDLTPRKNFTVPALEQPGSMPQVWSPTYVSIDLSGTTVNALQIWNQTPGKIPTGCTKIWVEMRVQIHGSGLICTGFDFYDSRNEYVGNGETSGFQYYLAAGATPGWQTITFGQ